MEVQQCDDAHQHARDRRRLTHHKKPQIVGVEAIGVLRWGHPFHHRSEIEARRDGYCTM